MIINVTDVACEEWGLWEKKETDWF
jgi:hypothetical protein